MKIMQNEIHHAKSQSELHLLCKFHQNRWHSLAAHSSFWYVLRKMVCYYNIAASAKRWPDLVLSRPARVPFCSISAPRLATKLQKYAFESLWEDMNSAKNRFEKFWKLTSKIAKLGLLRIVHLFFSPHTKWQRMGLSCEKSGKQELSIQRSPDRARDLVMIHSDFHSHFLKTKWKTLDFLWLSTLAVHNIKLNWLMPKIIDSGYYPLRLFRNQLKFLT